jgi:plastocyanin
VRRIAVLTGVALSLAAPAAANAATKTVNMGLPLKSQKSFQAVGADVNDFFPDGVTIHAGDSIRFVPTSFHTVDFPAKGKQPTPLLVPAPAISGANDAAAAPFWFNGQPSVQFNPAVLQPNYGNKLTYTRANGIQSGLPIAPKPKPMTVKFPKTGTYTYYCDVHPGMKGTVRVLAKSRTIPTAKQDKAKLDAKVAKALKVATALPKTTVAPNTVDVGEAGSDGVEYFGFLPGTLTVPAGTTVKFQMAAKSREVHTASTGPGDPEKDPTSYLGSIAASFSSPAPFDGRAIYPSDSALVSLTPSLHGNGFWSSGLMDSLSSGPLPASNSVTFGAPGTYQFYCLVHAFMHGTVVVT